MDGRRARACAREKSRCGFHAIPLGPSGRSSGAAGRKHAPAASFATVRRSAPVSHKRRHFGLDVAEERPRD